MQGTATFLAKADGVLAGLAVADLVSLPAFTSQRMLPMQAACASAVEGWHPQLAAVGLWQRTGGPHAELSPLRGSRLGSFPHSCGSLAAAAITVPTYASAAGDNQPAESQLDTALSIGTVIQRLQRTDAVAAH